MAKRSKKRVVRYEKDHSGCMWGLISIFDFRRHSTRKMITDKKDRSRHAAGTENLNNRFAMLTNLDEGCFDSNDVDKFKTAHVNKPSVKKLMEKEMVSEHTLKKGKQPDFKHEDQLDIGWKTIKKTKKKSTDIDMNELNNAANFGADCKSLELGCINDLSAFNIVEEFCQEISQKSTSDLKHDEDDSKEHMQPGEKLSNFEEKLADAVKEFTGQNFENWKHFTEGQKIQHLKEIAQALQISSFDEELLLKLVKCVHNLQDNPIENSEKSKSVLSKVENSDQIIDYKQYNFFRRKVKTRESDPSKRNEKTEASNRIVILKPGPSSMDSSSKSNSAREKVSSHFLLAELKRKFKHALGKERLEISNNSVSSNKTCDDSGKRVVKENSGRTFPSEEMYIERIIRSSNGNKNGDKNGKLSSSVSRTEQETSDSKKEVSNIYIEARKHLSEILSSGDEGVEFLTGHRPKTLGRILSIPEYNYSPIGSPRKDWQHGFVNGEMRYSVGGKSCNVSDQRRSPKRENSEINIGDDKKMEESRLSNENYTENEGNEEIVKTSETAVSEVKIDSDVSSSPSCSDVSSGQSCSDNSSAQSCSDVSSGQSCSDISSGQSCSDVSSGQSCLSITINDQNGDISDTSDNKKESEFSELELSEEHEELSPFASPSSSSIIKKSIEDTERISYIQDHLSPVSILEPFLSEEDISPMNATERPGLLMIQPLQIRFEEHEISRLDQVHELKTYLDDKNLVFSYVKKVLLASDLSQKDLFLNSLSPEQLIKPSLLDEIDVFSNRLCLDRRLLFDCIHEVVVDFYRSISPWLSHVTRPCVRSARDFQVHINEVCKGVYWHILPLPLPRTLDHLVRKDLERIPNWIELQFDHELITIEMSELLFEDVVDDVILSCLSTSLE